MATRLYLSNRDSPNFIPSFVDSWNSKTYADTKGISTSKANLAFSTKGAIETTSFYYHVLVRQYLTPPLAAGIVFNDAGTDYVKAQIRAIESNLAANMKLRLRVIIYLEDGSWQDQVISAYESTEFATSLTNRTFSEVQDYAIYTTVGGERLSIQIGYRCENNLTTPFTGSFEFGCNSSSDLPENETSTDQFCPWIEFSQNITFLPEPPSTRLYFPSGTTSPFESEISGSWLVQNLCTKGKLVTEKQNSAFQTVSVESTNGLSVAILQFTSDPIAAGVTFKINDTIKGQFKISGTPGSPNIRPQVSVGLITDEHYANYWGTTFDIYQSYSYFTNVATTLTNKAIPIPTILEDSLSEDYVTVGGERIVAIVGCTIFSGAGTSIVNIQIGDNSSTDLPENETSTDNFCSWIEFGTEITFITEPEPEPESPYGALTYYTLTDILSATGVLINSVNTINVKFDTINSNMSSIAAGASINQGACILFHEHYNRQDLDGDGLIYGYDFYILVDRPEMLERVPKHGTPISWQDYQDSHPELF